MHTKLTGELEVQQRRFNTASQQETLPCTSRVDVQQETALPWWHPAHTWFFSPGHKLPMSDFTTSDLNWELSYWAS